MTTYYLDTSALLKRYVAETGSARIREIVSPDSGHALLTSRITVVEVYSAIARRKREGTVPPTDCDAAARAFTAHATVEYRLIELSDNVIRTARDFLNQFPLRAYDAIQLASAWVADHQLVAADMAPLVFLSADDRLVATARSVRMAADNPNGHL